MEEEGRYSCVGQTRLDTVTSRAAWLTVDGEDRTGELPTSPQLGLTASWETGSPGLPALPPVEVEGGIPQEKIIQYFRRNRERPVAVPASGGGSPCTEDQEEEEVCNPECCVPVCHQLASLRKSDS